MKRRQFLQTAGLAAAAGTVAKPAIAQSTPELKWRLTSSFPKSLDTLYGTAEIFAKAVAEATDNKFQIQVFSANEIVPALSAMDAVQNGTVEMCHTASYYYFGKDPTFAFGTAVPFGLNTRMQNAWMYHGGGAELMNEFFKKFNIIALPCGNTGCQMGGWFRREVKEVADLRGLKMRIGGFAGTVTAKLGVVPQQIAGGEIYSALEKGTIDAAEWVGPYDDEKLGFQRIAPFYYYPGWWEYSPSIDLMVNARAYEQLPAAYKAILEAACAESWHWMAARYDVLNPAAMRRLIAAGTQLKVFPRDVLQASYRASQELFAELGAQNPRFKRIYEQWDRFRIE